MSATTNFKDHFLLAMPGLADPTFRHALIYICEHNEHGAMGLVINHPSDVTLGRVFEEFELDYPADIGDQPLLSGGPVQQERGFVIHRPGETQWTSTLQVSPAVCITASRDIIVDIASRRGPPASYVSLGYSGWSAGQLEQELADNSWLVCPADPEIIFDTPFPLRARATAERMGIDLSRLSTQAGHA